MNKLETKIAKEFNWEMSHRLPFHKGLCKNIHGHSYKLRVELSGNVETDGMVLDYYDLKLLVMPIVEQFDHSFLVDKDDKLMIEFLKANNFKYNIFEQHTTAENIAYFLADELSNRIKDKYKNIHKVKIRLYETENVYAEIENII